MLPSLGGTPEERPCHTYHSRVPERDAPRVVIAPQSFKGSADAVAVASAIARGVRRVWPRANCVELPLADGGEGTALALVRATGGEMRNARVHDPLGREIDAQWGVLGDRTTAVLEMAAASGLPLLREVNLTFESLSQTPLAIRHEQADDGSKKANGGNDDLDIDVGWHRRAKGSEENRA